MQKTTSDFKKKTRKVSRSQNTNDRIFKLGPENNKKALKVFKYQMNDQSYALNGPLAAERIMHLRK